MDPVLASRSKQRVALLSVVSNALLVIGKLAAGFAIGSVSVISEAIHSAIDLLAAIIALIAVRLSGAPPDKNHPFGHEKTENVSGLIEALLIFLAAAWITVEAVKKLISDEPLGHPGLGIAIMLISAAANWGVSTMLFRVGRKTHSMALIADAWHLRTDIWTSLGVLGGLAIIQLGHWFLPGVDLDWVDPVAAICVAGLITHAAWELSRQACHDLLDSSLPEADVKWLEEYMTHQRPGVFSVHKLRSRKAGGTRFVECHMVVDKELTVEVSHRITDDITAGIRDKFPGTQVLIHVEPEKLLTDTMQ